MFSKPDRKSQTKIIKKRRKYLKELFGPRDMQESRKLLDVGGGTGINYAAAKQLDLEVFYQDWDKDAKEYVKSEFGLDNHHIIGDDYKTKHRFDIIFVGNVIEHVVDPKKFLSVLGNLLAKEGVIIFKTPHARNSESIFNPLIIFHYYFLEAKKYNSIAVAVKSFFFWYWHCDPPRHLYSFS